GLPVSPPREIPVSEVPVPTLTAAGEPTWGQLDTNSGQDIAMWYTQGLVADRSREHLGRGDEGVILFRKLLRENIAKVERSEDPMNVCRDPAANMCIELPVEQKTFATSSYKTGQQSTGNVTKYSRLAAQEQGDPVAGLPATAASPAPVSSA